MNFYGFSGIRTRSLSFIPTFQSVRQPGLAFEFIIFSLFYHSTLYNLRYWHLLINNERAKEHRRNLTRPHDFCISNFYVLGNGIFRQ